MIIIRLRTPADFEMVYEILNDAATAVAPGGFEDDTGNVISVMKKTSATWPRSYTPSFGRHFRGAGSAASSSLGSPPRRTPGGAIPASTEASADRSGRYSRGPRRWVADSRPAGPSAPPGVLRLINKIC